MVKERSLACFLLRDTACILEALQKIDSADNFGRVVFVVNAENRVVGSITDGDIRRALLRGESLSSPVTHAVQKDFVSVLLGLSAAEIQKKMRRAGIRQIPILDYQGQLVDVKMLEEIQNSNVNFPVVIMAGGRGSRLLPYTENLPKPLLKVGGQTIVDRLITSFRKQGVQKFYVSINYLADQIVEHLGDGRELDCQIEYIRESKPLGTAGSLSLLRDKLKSEFLVINGDVLSTVDLAMLQNFHREHKGLATICAKVFTMRVPYGVVKIKNYNMLEIDEKPELSFSVNAGIYFLSPKVLSNVADDQYLDMTTLVSSLISDGLPVKCFQSGEPWMDIGSPVDFQKAEKYLEHFTK